MPRPAQSRPPLRELPELEQPRPQVNGVGDSDLGSLARYDSELAWLDDVLSSAEGDAAQAPSLAALDARVSRLVSQLDVATSDTSQLVASTIDTVARTVPRLALDLQLMRENAVLLGYGLQTVRQKTVNGAGPMILSDDEGAEREKKVAEEAAVLEKLRLLDLTRTRMDAARSVLREAESWSTLDSDIRSHLVAAAAAAAAAADQPSKPSLPGATMELASDPYRQAALRLAEATRSLSVFIASAEYPSRSALLRSLTDDLEAAVCPVLVGAVASRHNDEVIALKEVFGLVGRGGREFESWYWAGRRETIATLWTGAQLIDAPSSTADDASTDEPVTLADFLGDQFFPLLLNIVLDEIPHLAQVFPAPLPHRILDHDPPHTPSRLVHSPFAQRVQEDPLPKTDAAVAPSQSALQVLSTFLASTLEALSPSLSTRLSGSADESSARTAPLEELIKSYKSAESFALQFERCLGKLETLVALEAGLPAPGTDARAASPLPSPSSPSLASSSATDYPATASASSASAGLSSTNVTSASAATKRDRRSRRMSFNRRSSSRKFSVSGGIAAVASATGDDDGPLLVTEPSPTSSLGPKRASSQPVPEQVRDWEAALFEPFLEFQSAYHSLEQSHLSKLLTAHLRSHLPLARSAALLTGRQLTDALHPVLTWADAAWDRSAALTHGFGSPGCVRAVDSMLQGFLTRAKQAVEDVKAAAEELRGGAKRRGSTDQGEGGAEAVDLEGLDYSSKDWEVFQAGLRLLEACRTISDRVAALDARFKSKLVALSAQLRDAQQGVAGTTRGAVTLLRQSALNSRELAVLLDNVFPGSSESRKVSGTSTTGADDEHAFRPGHAAQHARHSHASFSISGLPTTPGTGRARGDSHVTEQPALVFGHARAGVTALTKACQSLVHSSILAPLMAQLALYPTLPVWSATAADVKAQSSSVAAIADMQMPKFSLSPTETISRIGEGLFNLPRLFDVYAADEALTFSIETLPFVDADSLLRSFGVEPLPSPPLALRPAKRGGMLDAPGSARRSASPSSRSSVRPPASLPNLSAETVISTWISSLALSVISHLTSDILPSFPRLSAHGAAQMASDLTHISNVAQALEAEGDELDRWREACDMDPAEGKRRLGEGEGDEILAKVARLRGWVR